MAQAIENILTVTARNYHFSLWPVMKQQTNTEQQNILSVEEFGSLISLPKNEDLFEQFVLAKTTKKKLDENCKWACPFKPI